MGLVTKEEFDTQRGGEEGGREGEEGDGEMVFPLDLQEGGGGETEGAAEGESPQKKAMAHPPPPLSGKKGQFYINFPKFGTNFYNFFKLPPNRVFKF